MADMEKKVAATPMQKDLQAWDEKQAAYIKRYGPEVMNDREFMKAKFEVIKHIRDAYSNTRLSMDDKIERAILKGQVTQLQRRIYPNVLIRTLAQIGDQLLKLFTDTDSMGSQRYVGKEVTRSQPVNRLTGEGQAAVNQQKQQPEEKIVARNLRRPQVLTDLPQNGMKI